MSYSQFETLEQAIDSFNLTVVEGLFFPELAAIDPSDILTIFLQRSLPIVSAASEKARSEGIIYPVLLEVREILDEKVSLFSGRDFNVDASIGLNGIVDFLLCRSPIISIPTAPAVVLVEAKKGDIASGYGQCLAEMVAAMRFNLRKGLEPIPVYGCVTNGLLWRFLKLEANEVTLDLIDYRLEPVGNLLAKLVWMVSTVDS
ncbi:MAG: hypothetical protein HC786_18785 [Richelia sp. CSU_2_1]|nr:hypothetical protein [Microcoleus sp. SU_5_6]NJR24053.1 hypothetical protein [Richelia sp. CSU_2_1]